MKINKKVVTTSLLLAFCSGFSATASANFFSSIENMFHHKTTQAEFKKSFDKQYHMNLTYIQTRKSPKSTKGVVVIDNATVHKLPVPVTTKSPVSKITP